MKHLFLTLAIGTAVLTVSAANPVVMGSAINIEKTPMVLGDPVAGISGPEGDIHASHGKIQGLIEVVGISGIEDVKASVAFKIYPNPTTEILNVECDPEFYNSISLTDMSGSIRFSHIISEKHTSISLADMPTGIYILSISDKAGKSTVTAKIIKH